MKNILIKLSVLFLLAVFITGKFLKPNKPLPPLCDGPSKDLYLLAYAYSKDDIAIARRYLLQAQIADMKCPELSNRVKRLEQRLNLQKNF